jgi:hypothetical protein
MSKYSDVVGRLNGWGEDGYIDNDLRQIFQDAAEAITKLEADVAILTNNNEALERDDKILRDHTEELEALLLEYKDAECRAVKSEGEALLKVAKLPPEPIEGTL